MKTFTVTRPTFLLVLFVFIVRNESAIPNERRCGDKDCSGKFLCLSKVMGPSLTYFIPNWIMF